MCRKYASTEVLKSFIMKSVQQSQDKRSVKNLIMKQVTKNLSGKLNYFWTFGVNTVLYNVK